MTAIDVLDEKIDWDIFSNRFPETAMIVKEALIKFAKMHVEKALQSAAEKAIVNKDSITSAYAEENIV